MANNFGVMVNIPGVPPHIHQGNDISAPAGTPIVAPFDGTAVATNNDLGGLAVDVYGALGHVYNAHLSSYGKLGAVKAGDVIGYVGTTGDATSPHDHFEWHPNDGPAVDPQPVPDDRLLTPSRVRDATRASGLRAAGGAFAFG